jgi:hypothetical protein
MDSAELVRTVAAAATPVAVSIAAAQLKFNRGQAKLAFEDSLNREYREIVAALPADTFRSDPDMTRSLTPDEEKAMLRYFDLCNEQLRMARSGRRISRRTARAWRDGIEQNLLRPRIRHQWELEAARLPDDYFTELAALMRRLEADHRSPITVRGERRVTTSLARTAAEQPAS